MEKNLAQRIKELAEQLKMKAEELKRRLEGVESYGNKSKNSTKSR